MKERFLLKLLINVCKGSRCGIDLGLAEVAARYEAEFRARLEALERAERTENQTAEAA